MIFCLCLKKRYIEAIHYVYVFFIACFIKLYSIKGQTSIYNGVVWYFYISWSYICVICLNRTSDSKKRTFHKRLIDTCTTGMIDGLMDLFVDGLIVWLMDLLIGGLIVWLMDFLLADWLFGCYNSISPHLAIMVEQWNQVRGFNLFFYLLKTFNNCSLPRSGETLTTFVPHGNK